MGSTRSSRAGRQAVIVFSRAPFEEARAKHVPHLAPLFERLAARALAAGAAAADADLVLVGSGLSPTVDAVDARLPQRGRTLGERIVAAFEDVASLGYEQIVMIGTDSPGLEPGDVRDAFARLDGGSRLVLGPSRDGGAYLIGVRDLDLERLRDVPWGTSSVLCTLVSLDAATALLPARRDDVDRAEDLHRLLRTRLLPREIAALVVALLALARRDTRRLLAAPPDPGVRPRSLRGPPRAASASRRARVA